MAVTEVALLCSGTGRISDELRQGLERARPVQQQWYATHHPGKRLDDAVFQQVEDPGTLLVTACWTSVEAHHQWIGSQENQEIMKGLRSHVMADQVVLFHLDTEIFTPTAAKGTISLLDSPVISVGRLSVDADKKEAFAAKFAEARQILEEYVAPYIVKVGWRVDKEDETKDEFVTFCGFDSVEKHAEFTSVPRFEEFDGIRQFVSKLGSKQYKRFL